MNILGFIGWFLLIPVTCKMMKMIDSMSDYMIKETTQISNIYSDNDTIESLEAKIETLSRSVSIVKKELNKDYVYANTYNRDKLLIKDDIQMLYNMMNNLHT